MTVTFALAATTFATLAIVRLWQARRTSSSTGLLVVAVPLALLPAVLSVAVASFRLKSGFERIAETGHGGVGIVMRIVNEVASLTLFGTVAGVIVLGGALVLAIRSGAFKSPVIDKPSRPVALIVIAALLVAGSAYLVTVAERQSVGTAVRFSRLINEPPPAGYSAIALMSTQQWTDELERSVRTTTTGGIALVVLVAGFGAVTRGFARRLSASARLTSGAIAGVALVVAVGIWFCIRLGTAVEWVHRVAERAM